MCGICGFYGKKDRQLLKSMAAVLSHRGPDDEGFYEDESVSLGHRRLSIIDLSEKGRQPIPNEDLTAWAAVNGEIYNFKALREELESRGHTFRSQSDSEVIVHAYEEYGEDFVLKLDGMFALAVWDSRKKKLILARDRLGIKPLYYAKLNSGLFFASEIKSILQNPDFEKKINEDGFFQYLAFQCIITAETMFKGVYKLEPGHILIFKDNRLETRRYWDIDEDGSRETGAQDAGLALVNAVRSHLVSDVPIGVLLSGGLDSSSIVALMSEIGADNIETFTVGFGQPDDEFSFAGEVAARFNTKHHEIRVEAGHLRGLLEKITWHMDEPLADAGAIATYLASSRVREFVKVVLVGEGGDETLGGYNWHKLSVFPLSLLPKYFRKRAYFYMTTFYRYPSKIPFQKFIGLFNDKKNFFDAMSAYEINSILPNSLLMKVDKMTMANSIEARVPFLDHTFVRAAAKMDYKKKVSACSTKIFLRHFMRGRLPERILGRRKHGFLLPIDKWLGSELNGFAQDALFSSGNRSGCFLPLNFKKGLFRKKTGLASIENSSLLWRLLVFEVWHRAYFKNNG